MHATRAKLSRYNPVAKAIAYMLKPWTDLTRFLDDVRICMINNAAERAHRGIALGRKSWQYEGSDRSGERAADLYSLIITAKLNDVDRRPGLPASLPASRASRRTASTNCSPWEWRNRQPVLQAAA